jgi:hypothetical protein
MPEVGDSLDGWYTTCNLLHQTRQDTWRDITKECDVQVKWRVVVIRRNGELVALRDYKSRRSAERMQQRLLECHSFSDVWIERKA